MPLPHEDDPAFPLHNGGKIEIRPTVRVRDREDLCARVHPGGRPGSARRSPLDPALADDYTWRRNAVAVVTDGSAVLGLGNIGPRPRCR